jgi:hypothetical protein
MELQQAVAVYGAAWNELDDAGRRKLLEESWAESGVYCDPMGRADGRDALVSHIAGFQAQFPGARIEATSGADEHDGYFRFAWSMVDGEGNTTLEGFDVGHRADDGRIDLIVGFFGPFPEG